MRYIRYILDLPWWVGFPIFLVGNLLVPFGLFWYIIGLILCLFGCWTFSKLLPPEEHPETGFAALGFLLFFIVMLIPWKFEYISYWLSWLNGISSTMLYSIRAGLGLAIGFIIFNKGFRK